MGASFNDLAELPEEEWNAYMLASGLVGSESVAGLVHKVIKTGEGDIIGVLRPPGIGPQATAADGSVVAFDPNQPRDRQGQWRKVPGGGSVGEIVEAIGGADVSPDEFWSLYDKVEELQDPRTELKEIRTTAGHRITVDPEHPGSVETGYSGEEKVNGARLIVEFPDLESWRRGNPDTILDKAKEIGDVEVRKDGTVRDRAWDAKSASDMVAQQTPGEAIRVPVDRVEEQPMGGLYGHSAATSPWAPGTVYTGEWLKPEDRPLIRRLVSPGHGGFGELEDPDTPSGQEEYGFQEQRLGPDTPLYHVSANLPEVERDGYLTVGQGGGLGAFGEEESVSFTLDGDAVPVMVGDMKRHIRLAKALPDPPPTVFSLPSLPPKDYPGTIEDYKREVLEPARAARSEWSRKMLDLLHDEAEREGWNFNVSSFQSSQTESYDFGDWLGQYYGARPASKGGNPVYLHLDQADQRERDEANIGALQTTLAEAQGREALLTYLYAEDEVRVYADMPVTAAKVIA